MGAMLGSGAFFRDTLPRTTERGSEVHPEGALRAGCPISLSCPWSTTAEELA